MALVRYGLVLLGLALCLWGAHAVQQGIPEDYYSRGIGDLQADANRILLGIAWEIGGIACGIFALAFSPASLAVTAPGTSGAGPFKPVPGGG